MRNKKAKPTKYERKKSSLNQVIEAGVFFSVVPVLPFFRKIAVDNGFRLSEDSQYVMCCDTDEEEEEDFRFYEQPPEGEKETSAVLPDFDSDWNWPSE